MLKHDLSILIPTHNRKQKLETLLSYIFTQIDVPVFVIDSSEEEGINFQHPNFQYIYVKGLNLVDKLDYIKYVKTKYVLLFPDDDQPALNGILDSIIEAEKEIENVSSIIGITLDYKEKEFQFYRFHKPFSYHFYCLNKNLSRKEKTAIILQYYTQVMWAIHRTDYLIEFVDFIPYFVKPISMFERNFVIFMQMKGDIYFSKKLFSFRARDPSVKKNIIDFPRAYRSLDFADDVRRIKFEINKIALAQGLISEEEDIATKIFDKHLTGKTKKISNPMVKLLKKFPKSSIIIKGIEFILRIKSYNIVTPFLDHGYVTIHLRKLIPLNDPSFQEDMRKHHQFIMSKSTK